MRSLIITLDGPAGSGKSTTARMLAQRLGIDFLDTGAMYRAIAVLALDRGLDTETQEAEVCELARHARLRFDWSQDPPRVLVNDEDVTTRLRSARATAAVSDVAQMSGVRKELVLAQREIGREHPRLVTEGRDQGSVVFPHADVKFYLDAQPQVRARRRTLEMADKGEPVDEQEVLAAIIRRDERDMARRDGPLTCPDDAIRVDTSDLTREEVVAKLELLVHEKTGGR